MGACSKGTDDIFIADWGPGCGECLEETDPRLVEKFHDRIVEDRLLGWGSVYRLRRDGTIQPIRIGPTCGARVMSKFDSTNEGQVAAFLRVRNWKTDTIRSKVLHDPIEMTAFHRTKVALEMHTESGTGNLYFFLSFNTEWGQVTTPAVWVDVNRLSQIRTWLSHFLVHALPLLSQSRFEMCKHRCVQVFDCTFSKTFKWRNALCPLCTQPTGRKDQEEEVVVPLVKEVPVVRPVPRKTFTETSPISISNQLLRDALHKAFHGKCQFCYREVARSEGMEVDHLFPKSKSIEEIRAGLLAQGLETAHVEAFIARRWHGTHDCVLNYTLLCADCNIKKSNDLLDVGALSMRFTYTQKQAAEVLAYINRRSG